MGGLGDDKDEFACGKTIKGEKDDEIVKEMQEKERVKFSQKYREAVRDLETQINTNLEDDNECSPRRLNIVDENTVEGECLIPIQGLPICDGKGVGIKSYLPDLDEMDIPEAPQCKKPKDCEDDRLNKVKDFFGLETLDGVKADKLLETASNLFRTKNAEHGDAYLKIGYMLEQAFPDGVTLKTHHDFNKFTTLVQMLYKITRLCNTCFGEKETIHDSVFDSPRDLCVYGSIFGEIQIKELKDKVKKDASKL